MHQKKIELLARAISAFAAREIEKANLPEVLEGFVVMPLELTDAQLAAAGDPVNWPDIRLIYKALVEARPTEVCSG